MKIALVNKHYRLGGIETIVHQLWRGLPARGTATELWISEFDHPPKNPSVRLLYPPLLNRLLHSRFARLTQHAFPRRAWTARAFEKIQRSESDVIHVHGFDETYAPIETLVKLARTKPVAVTLHGAWFFTGGCGQPLDCDRYTKACGQCPQAGVWPVPADDNTAEELERKNGLLAETPIYFVSPSVHLREKALHSAVGKDWNITHLPNGVNTALFRGDRKRCPATRRARGLEPDRLVILVMCRDFRDPVKGTSLMTGALKKLAGQNIQVLLAGGFGETVAAELPDSVRPTPVGYAANDRTRSELFEIADIFFFTSLAETFPCVVLEAMSAECCVVSTPLEGVREQLQHGVSGLLANGFTSQSVADTLALACEWPERAADIGRRARVEVLTRFSEETMLERHEELYQRLAG